MYSFLDNTGLGTSAIIIIVVCVVCGVALVVAALVFFVWKKRSKKGTGKMDNEMGSVSKK